MLIELLAITGWSYKKSTFNNHQYVEMMDFDPYKPDVFARLLYKLNDALVMECSRKDKSVLWNYSGAGSWSFGAYEKLLLGC